MSHAFIQLAAGTVLLAVGCRVQAGTILGAVLEQASGRPLARSVVRLDPVPHPSGTKIQPLATRAGKAGQFVFQHVVPGIYVLHAVREGYYPAAYGQRLPAGRGTPIEVTTDSKLFAELRLLRKGAITGRVLDENDVAMVGIPVVAYRAQLPLRSAGSAKSDDRGVYRIHGLDPGKYWIRSGAFTLDDGSGWLPAWGPRGREVRDARTHRVMVDADTMDADVSPEQGVLFRLGGPLECEGMVLVTLSSETGRRTIQTGCRGGYLFEGLAPGAYEVFVTTLDGAATGFLEHFLARDHLAATVKVMELPPVDIEVRRAGSNAVASIPIKLMARRQDLSETEPEREITGPRTALATGNWELRAHVPSGQYVESISSSSGGPRRPWKAERSPDRYEVFIHQRFPVRIRIAVSDQAGEIAGTVTVETKPAPGAPVFLWPVRESARRSLSGPLQALSDTEGRFRFHGLPPGDYRVLASFDVNEIDEELIEISRAAVVRAEAAQTATIDLPLWVAPW